MHQLQRTQNLQIQRFKIRCIRVADNAGAYAAVAAVGRVFVPMKGRRCCQKIKVQWIGQVENIG